MLHQGQVLPDQPSVFYDGVTAYMDKGRTTDVIHLGSSKAFDTVPHNIPVEKLAAHSLDGRMLH